MDPTPLYRWAWLLIIHSQISKFVTGEKIKGLGASELNNSPVFTLFFAHKWRRGMDDMDPGRGKKELGTAGVGDEDVILLRTPSKR